MDLVSLFAACISLEMENGIASVLSVSSLRSLNSVGVGRLVNGKKRLGGWMQTVWLRFRGLLMHGSRSCFWFPTPFD